MHLLQRLLGALVAIALLVAAFFIASVLLTVVAVIALAVWAWLWWRTRNLPRPRAPGETIEGEFRVEREIRLEREIRRGDGDPR
jgi:membrane protein implicated in regulation of membrane protease activity